MTRRSFSAAVAVAVAVLIPLLTIAQAKPGQAKPSAVQGKSLVGKAGRAEGATWQSSFRDLTPAQDFRRGDRLNIKVHGLAQLVCIRLLPEGSAPESPDGLVATKMKVQAGGVLEVLLAEDHPKVTQISVHAKQQAWDIFLGANNGTVEIQSIEHIPHR